ncbi:MAG: RtcB family protein [Oligoflexia bacterium]|nr:RtcB family protein [Oligoflexia bacterium]
MKIFNRGKLKIISWCNAPEEDCLQQAANLSNFPFTFKHVALMPDTHTGYGMPIGGVVGLLGVISPNMVGVDIGCGMCAVKTSLQGDLRDKDLKDILSLIRRAIPVGFKHHKRDTLPDYDLLPALPQELVSCKETVLRREEKVLLEQLGTLGGGNHFIEIQRGSDGHIWFMLHSGSRNLGLQVANYYNKIAIRLNQRIAPQIPKEWQLAYLPLDSDEGVVYMQEMQYCLSFAAANRNVMAMRIKAAISEITAAQFLDEINIHHNYARMEKHFDTQLMVHRKGATSAFEGELGIIPGSQGTPSYIVRGKGNEQAFKSSSHGAGRKMGREEAKRRLNFEQEKRCLDDLGIIHSLRSVRSLDEAPSAYKDIDVVMEEQRDLVDIVLKLTPLAVIKG